MVIEGKRACPAPARLRTGARGPFRVAAACFALAIGLVAAWTAWQPLRSEQAGNDALDTALKGPQHVAQARALARTAHDRNPLSIDPLVNLGFVETVAHDRAAARNAFEQAIRLQPSNPAAWEYLATFALEQEHNPRLALRLLGPALYLDPKSPTGAKDYLGAMRALTAQAEAQALAKRRAKAHHHHHRRR